MTSDLGFYKELPEPWKARRAWGRGKEAAAVGDRGGVVTLSPRGEEGSLAGLEEERRPWARGPSDPTASWLCPWRA